MSRPSYTGQCFTVEQLARSSGISRQAYYQRRARCQARQARHEQALERGRQVRRRHPKMGTRKLYREHYATFRSLGIGRDALFGLLRRHGLLLEPTRSKRRTTHSRHGLPTRSNLLTGYTPERSNEVFVSDITYLETLDSFHYLALVTDAYSRKIVGWDLSRSLSVEGSLRALDMALGQTTAEERRGLIHHSDRGVQYCCHVYTGRLEAVGARISMAEVGNPYENAQAERVNGILKHEYGLGGVFATGAQARAVAREAIYLYNEERPHLALCYQKPSQVHARKRLAA